MSDLITIEVNDLSKVSDGYHTIQELYDHRCLLWILCCLNNVENCYIKKDHYNGWFLLGMFKDNGFQISYHCPNKYLNYVNGIIEEDNNVEWDKHTPQDVIERLEDTILCISNALTI